TGITMEFQFGTNWAYYSHYVGDIFGVPLAIEGLMAFFLESTFIGLFFFGWERLSKRAHLVCTFLLALGTNLSALWILIANAWMQNPVGAHFNPDTMRMELASFSAVFFNPVAQAKFVHTLAAGYVVGSTFMLAISAYFLLKEKHLDIMKRSFTVAAAFGLAACLCVIVLGDESGYELTLNQQMKIAGIEAMWHKEKAPASFTLIGIPDPKTETTEYAVKVPWILGLIATRSLDQQVPDIRDLLAEGRGRIVNGIKAYGAVEDLRKNRNDAAARATLDKYGEDLGYGLLLKADGADPLKATPQQIDQADQTLMPHVGVMFWSFRFMVAIGFWLLGLFAMSFWAASTRAFNHPRLLKAALYSLPLPWIAAELGWIVAEYGRQPWAIEGILPTRLAGSAAAGGLVVASIAAFVIFYTALLVVDVALMVKYAKRGPEHV
ncbi:MAG: cytochrome ubiquinol oxidase subunit I, partial [Alphaproteobacteria bacterium]|nr:cytochrome ubiquinol oxidase subunit I [Alphaproteobacteria bacterium]